MSFEEEDMNSVQISASVWLVRAVEISAEVEVMKIQVFEL